MTGWKEEKLLTRFLEGLDQTLLMEEKEKMLRSMLEILPIINLIERKTRLQFKIKERDLMMGMTL